MLLLVHLDDINFTHRFPYSLEGAEEISPGTGIFKGGIEAAMAGILSGKYKPLDFRFFIGHTNYIGGQLDKAVSLGKYQPVACSRPLVLKQCIQLPKPLWHEGELTYFPFSYLFSHILYSFSHVAHFSIYTHAICFMYSSRVLWWGAKGDIKIGTNKTR